MPQTEAFPLALPAGTVLAEQYKIEEVLGQGGFGITYRAMDKKSQKRVAVKEFFPDTLAYREHRSVVSYPGERSENYVYGLEGFLHEAETLRILDGNENIVRIYRYFEENGTAYFVMDYIEGVSFEAYIAERGGKISVAEAKQILFPIMDALDAVHAKGIIHRDVTPDNIYITKDGVVKLLDFGAARYSLGDRSCSLDVILKHGFAPMEQYKRHGKQGAYTDIYSLAATFYYAVTGKRPPDAVERIDEESLIPPHALGIEITEVDENALLQAMRFQPYDRFQTMRAFRRAMQLTYAPVPQPVPVPPVSAVLRSVADDDAAQPEQEKPDGGLPEEKLKTAVIIILIVMLGVAGLLLIRGGADRAEDPQSSTADSSGTDTLQAQFSKYLQWDAHGVFLIDDTLFGKSHDEIGEMLGVQLESFGYSEIYLMRWGYYSFEEDGMERPDKVDWIEFQFKEDQCVAVISVQLTQYDMTFADYIAEYYGEINASSTDWTTDNIYIPESDCFYSMSNTMIDRGNDVYDDGSVQQYKLRTY